MSPTQAFDGRAYVVDTSAWALPVRRAAATARRVGVLHYDEHFDRLAMVLGFDSRWIVTGGSA